MALQLTSTHPALSALLETFNSDKRYSYAEAAKIRHDGLQAIEKLENAGVLDEMNPSQLKEFRMLVMGVEVFADALIDTCVNLSKLVYEANKAHKAANAGSRASTAGVVALNESRQELIDAVEFQIASVVVVAEATIGRILIE